ncbi:hypothetical protein B6F84_01480 [Acidianus manzaensis]|uniref:Uncharacterized protein n=2 Tax=Acidianus manzaensis TaxID=282676 RepID=A0A1W6JX51_9CREN|nr:hypothetical protein B6F84_01480 [Acidianus manzaensis]
MGMREGFLILDNYKILKLSCYSGECDWFVLDQNTYLYEEKILNSGKFNIVGNAEDHRVMKLIFSFILAGINPNNIVCKERNGRIDCIKDNIGFGLAEGKWSGKVFFDRDEVRKFLATLSTK